MREDVKLPRSNGGWGKGRKEDTEVPRRLDFDSLWPHGQFLRDSAFCPWRKGGKWGRQREGKEKNTKEKEKIQRRKEKNTNGMKETESEHWKGGRKESMLLERWKDCHFPVPVPILESNESIATR